MAIDSDITIFTAVPTVYAKLLEYYNFGVEPDMTPNAVKKSLAKLR